LVARTISRRMRSTEHAVIRLRHVVLRKGQALLYGRYANGQCGNDRYAYESRSAVSGAFVLINVTVKLFINPTVVLISSVADDEVLNTLDPNAEARGFDGGSGTSTSRQNEVCTDG